MASYSWATATSGDWNTSTLWSGGTAPNLVPNAPDANAVIDVANATTLYTVTIAPTESITLASLTLNAQGDGTNDPTGYKGDVLEMDGTLAFTGSGTIGGSLQTQLLSNGGTFVNVGNLAPFTVGSGTVLFEGGNPFYVQDELESQGTVIVDTASIGELIQNTLTDGIYAAVGDTSVLDLGGTGGGLKPGITKIQGPPDQTAQYGFQGWTELQMNGPAAVINEWNGTAYVSVEATLNDVGGGGLLEALSGRGYTTANTMTLEARSLMWVQGGTTSIDGGLVLNTGTNSAIGGVFEGFGSITNGVTNNGTMVALGGTLDIVGALTGTGVVQFDKDYENFIQFGPTQGTIVTSPTGATLVVNSVSAGQTIVMNGDDTLRLDTPSSFAGTIVAEVGDQIILTGVTTTSAMVNGGTLLVFDGTQTVASVVLSGDYSADHVTASGSTLTLVAGAATGPTISGAAAGQMMTDQGTITPFSRVVIADPSVGQAQTVTVTLSAAANGTLTNLGGGSYNATTGVYTDTGSASAVTADLAGLVFTPTVHEVAPGQTVTTTFTISDIDTGSASATDSKTTVVATAAGAPPPGEVILHGPAAQYVIADDNGSLYIQDTVPGRDGTQTLPGVNEMVFTNGVGVFDPTGTAEEVARLYGAALDRAPDLAGLQGWTADIDDSHVPLSAVANDFTTSPEFIQDYGQLSDAAFVNRLYQNVLNRAPDAAGAQDWENALAGGMSRGTVALGFAESQEYEADTLSTAGDNDNGEIYRLYGAAFGRTPDAPGQAFWSAALGAGATITQIAQSFVGSAEFQADYGGLGVDAFVTALYHNALGRAPDAAGLQAWTNALNGGASEASVLVGFSDSLENRVNTASATHANWVFIPS